MSQPLDIGRIAEHLADVAARRDWTRFHNPKNLAMAIAGEAGELAAEFQWLTAEESWQVMADPTSAMSVREEIADVLQYLIRLADLLDIHLEAALWEKLGRNEERFPGRESEGSPPDIPTPPFRGVDFR